MSNDSAFKIWEAFTASHSDIASEAKPKSRILKNIGDLDLILRGKKKAQSYSLSAQQLQNKPRPALGDFWILSDQNNRARCILQTTSVRLRPLFNIPQSFIELEGNGFKNSEAWREFVWQQFASELEPFGKKPHESMIVVCEEFNIVFQTK